MKKCQLNKLTRLASLVLILVYVVTLTRVYKWHFDSSLQPNRGEVTARELLRFPPQQYSLKRVNSRATKSSSRTLIKNNTTVTPMGQSREKLQLKMNRVHADNTNAPVDNLWNISDYLPVWMKEYFEWHSEKRQELSIDAWKAGKVAVLVLQCPTKTIFDEWIMHFTMIPYMLRIAFETNRIFLIDCGIPLPLTDFLVPPIGGMDWRFPNWLKASLAEGSVIRNQEGWRNVSKDQNSMVVLQIGYNVAAEALKTNGTNIDAPFAEVYHDFWRVSFTPSETVRKNIEKVIRSNHMAPTAYTSIYSSEETNNDNILERAIEILACASQLHPGGPYFMMAVNEKLSQAATALAASQSVAIYTSPQEILHPVDKNSESSTSLVFLHHFVHLYLMEMGRCLLSTGPNGLASLAALIGYNSKCLLSQPQSCEWKMNSIDQSPLLEQNKQYFRREMPQKGSDFTSGALVETSPHSTSSLPQWMEDYFVWHNHTKSNLNKANWNSTKYLIIGCFESHKNCGGISDRLKPLPMTLLQAYRYQRLLLIWWEKPKPLEEFLLPPSGGVDWIAPQWLRENLKREMGERAIGSWTGSFEQGEALLQGGHFKVSIVFKIQTPSAGENLFREKLQKDQGSSRDGSTYKEVFHHLFRRFFRPVHRIQDQIDQKMQAQGLIPGEYTAAHLRALYGKRNDRDLVEMVDLAVLGVNCASNLSPGRPVYFASDSSFATKAAQTYAHMHGLPVTSLGPSNVTEATRNPIHLDKDPDWRARNPSSYDPTFVDLYMLAQSRCVAHSNGGYGSFGSLLSYDADCNMRFFKGSHKIKRCMWMSNNGERQDLAVPNVTNITMSL
ncbi:hypothetical protein IV203_027517 [Nitzschia inconspicua]|uniref:Uncharacterized protein n=1 Tax=Nitzschia inconspicua TaxID=303405 RepID=A0A9K3LZ19_9STRA|nr:hypothetical protein IV203_027517 [Nitzschia inconspicua]